MKLAVRRSSAAIAAVATAGVSSLFLGAAPASAAPTDACGAGATLVSVGICEQTFTSGSATFTPTAQMSKLEVLLVGAGGSGTNQNASGTTGYAAGGGGEVRLVDFSGSTAPLTVTVPASGVTGGVTDGTTSETVSNGANGSVDESAVATGGTSGSGNAGSSVPASADPVVPSYGGGGGAGGSASGADGGAGVVVDALASSGSLFDGDTRCFGGGGAVAPVSGITGVPGCGGGAPTVAGGTLNAPLANSGGGAGALTDLTSPGASGVVVIRWNANVTLAFNANGFGTAPAAQTVAAGAVVARPTDPVAEGYRFEGWYTDAELTTLADFAEPVTASTTYYAKWARVLPATGGAPDAAQLSVGIAALLAGAGLVIVGHRRKRRAN